MAVKCKEIMNIIEEWAPKGLAEDWDNPGLAVGDPEASIQRVLVALDVTPEVIVEALENHVDMIITHHPMILFQKIKSVTADTPIGKKLMQLIQGNICAYAAHTNLDVAKGGTNDVLAHLLELENIELLEETRRDEQGKVDGLGRIGNLKEPMEFGAFGAFVRNRLGLDSIRLVGNPHTIVHRAGLCTGSGVDFLKAAKNLGADVYITGDIRYHEAQKALEMGVCVADATHYASEVLIVPVILDYLKKAAASRGWDLEMIQSKVNGQTFWHQS